MKMRPYLQSFLPIILISCFCYNSYSQWVEQSYPSDPIAFSEIRETNGTLIATAFSDGVFRSDDNGGSWYSIADDLPSGINWNSLAVNGNHIFIGSTLAGLIAYKSENLGESWSAMDLGGVGSTTGIQELDEFSGDIYACGSFGILKSLDNGATWDTLANNGGPSFVRTIAFDNNALYVGSSSEGVFRSTNGGTDFTKISDSLSSGVAEIEIVNGRVIAFFNTERIIYYTDDFATWTPSTGLDVDLISQFVNIGADIFACGNGTYHKSSDNGATWALSNIGIPITNYARSLVQAPNGDIIGPTFRGIYKSTDNGNNWTPSNNGIEIRPVNFGNMVIDKGKYFMTGGFSIYSTDNTANSWNEDLDEMPVDPRPFYLVAVDNTIYAASFTGFVKSEDGGDSWVDLVDNSPVSFTRSLETDGADLYMGSFSEIFRSSDGGITWELLNEFNSFNARRIGFKDNYVFSGSTTSNLHRADKTELDWVIIGDELPQNVAVSAIVSNGSKIFLALETGIYASENYGDDWEHLTVMLPDTILVETVVATEEYVCAAIDNKVYFSPLDTIAWENINDGLPAEFEPEKFIIENNDLYVGGDFGLWKRSILDFYTDTKEIPLITELKVFPNPSQSFVFVVLENWEIEKGELTVINEHGQILHQEKLPPNPTIHEIDLSNFTSGLYFVEIVDSNKRYIGKVFIH